MRETYEVGPGRTVVVTVEVTGIDDQEAKLPSRNLYTDEQVANLQASEAELVAGPLRRRIAELERALANAIDRENALASWLERTEEKVRGYDHDRQTERDRADRERQRASELKDRLSSSEELVQEERIRGNNLAERLAKAEKALAESRELVAFKNQILNDKDDELREIRGLAADERNALAALEREHSACDGKLELREKDADTFRRQRNELEAGAKDLARRIDNARVLLSDARVVEARNKSITTLETVLGGAIGKALDTLA